jgi:hypothetical protein
LACIICIWLSTRWVITIPKADDPKAGSIPMDFWEKWFISDGLYFVPLCIAASISLVWKTFPIRPRYFKLYSLSNDGEALAFYFLLSVYLANSISII